jgi:membrane associated rhomboid family serine protease
MPPAARSAWFRVGTFDVNTSALVGSFAALSMFVYAIDKTFLSHFALEFSGVRSWQLWRLFTWPLVNEPSFWVALAIYFFWIFGSQLEDFIGKERFLAFLAAVVVIPASISTLVSFAVPYIRVTGTKGVFTLSTFHIPIFSIRILELAVFAAYAAEFPDRRFFFNMKSWIMAALLIGLDVLKYMGDRWTGYLLTLLLALAVSIVMLRSFGLGSELPAWVPKVPLPKSLGGGQRKGKFKPKRETKAGKLKSAIKRAEKAEASVTDISTMRPMEVSPEAQRARQAKIDGILDKISAHGINSLDEEELTILNERKR